MQIETIKRALKTSPFKPFTIDLPNGDQLPVDRPEQIGMTKRGETIVYFDDRDGGFAIVDTSAILDLEFAGKPSDE